MKLIVGLGNPGKEYHLTRHNVGKMVVESLAEEYCIKFSFKRRFKALTGEALIGEERCYLVMMQTVMNLSGHSVRLIVKWLKVDFKDILIILDDIALPFGSIRIRTKGSSAGHKGLQSVIDCLGSSEFSRMRIGILGRDNIKDLSFYVLDRFTKKEERILPEILKRALSACECWVKEGALTSMNRYNRKLDKEDGTV